MRTYISPSGFDTSQILSLIVKYGIEADDRIILIRPEKETDERAETTIQAVRDLSKQIDSSIKVEIHRVDHQNFEGMLLSLIDLVKKTEGEIIANISGGPREIFLAFAIACLSQSQKIHKTTNYSDVERVMREIDLPKIVQSLDEKSKAVLGDVRDNQPTTITEIAARLNLSESTISRQVGRLADLDALKIAPEGKKKQIQTTLTGEIFLLID
ncbi:MAG TPA: CRISPR locus-related DNA-binding protein [Methanotrichaceae archaeon]|nr:CRISPR locus-related DNA-binding protein [Methanotrichaceae archaeon]